MRNISSGGKKERFKKGYSNNIIRDLGEG